jgi:hypothetical protein
MKNETLIELADRWLEDANPDCTEAGGEDVSAVASRAYSRGKREAKRECADALRSLVSILG